MTKILPIIKHPNKILRQKAKEIESSKILEKDTQDLIDNMTATMWQADGVGLAAPQVGLSLRLIIVVASSREADALINPVIIYRSLRKEVMEEGCLSVT